MKKLYFLIVFFMVFLLLGCVTTERVIEPRVDQEITGNVGYLQGAPTEGEIEKRELLFEEREYFRINIEIPPFPEMRERYWEDDELWGNQGYIMGGPRR